jgi:hypothetical protein
LAESGSALHAITVRNLARVQALRDSLPSQADLAAGMTSLLIDSDARLAVVLAKAKSDYVTLARGLGVDPSRFPLEPGSEADEDQVVGGATILHIETVAGGVRSKLCEVEVNRSTLVWGVMGSIFAQVGVSPHRQELRWLDLRLDARASVLACGVPRNGT